MTTSEKAMDMACYWAGRFFALAMAEGQIGVGDTGYIDPRRAMKIAFMDGSSVVITVHERGAGPSLREVATADERE